MAKHTTWSGPINRLRVCWLFNVNAETSFSNNWLSLQIVSITLRKWARSLCLAWWAKYRQHQTEKFHKKPFSRALWILTVSKAEEIKAHSQDTGKGSSCWLFSCSILALLNADDKWYCSSESNIHKGPLVGRKAAYKIKTSKHFFLKVMNKVSTWLGITIDCPIMINLDCEGKWSATRSTFPHYRGHCQ